MKYFENINSIEYRGADSKNRLSFRHYNPDEIVNGKPMKEHMRFAVAYWHTLVNDGTDMFGEGTNIQPWFDPDDEMQTAKNKVEAMFEFLKKIGVEYFCFHDVDIAPQGNSLHEFFENLDVISDLILEKMKETGIKLLWNTANAFSHRRYVNGAASSNSPEVLAIYAAQVKKGLEINKKLSGENFVFWGGREGYESLLNTNIGFELDNIANFLKLALEYSDKIGNDTQFLLEPKPKEPMTHQYDFDASTTYGFLKHYGLEERIKLNIEANHATLAGHTFEHELNVARHYGVLGSLDANQGNPILGWDVDEFPTDLLSVTQAMYEVVENGGIAPGGINFDAKRRRTSFEIEDLFLAHIAGMDTYARAYKAAVRIKKEGYIEDIRAKRYELFDTKIGKEIVNKKLSLEDLSTYALTHPEPKLRSSNIEYYKSILNDYIYNGE